MPPGGTPLEMLPYDKNCVAMTFSRLLKQHVHATVRDFVERGWITSGTELENDNKIEYVIAKLGLTERYREKTWSTVKAGMKAMPNGRYFAMNWKMSGNTGVSASGHAFTIIVKDRSVGVYGNNAEVTGSAYISAIHPDHKISVYGPYTG